jgi:eukaryotic-like serine/threonine-protein kinase
MPRFSPLKHGDPERLGSYRILGRLGEGGQGVVYLATDVAGANVAVKWLRSELAGDRVSVDRFMREVQAAEQVAPFCTAAVLANGVESERPYIVSEFIEGFSLQQVVNEQGPRSGSSLHRLAIGTATALAAIHQAGIVHRDFKPANVILGGDGPRVIDFGIARALDATSTLTGVAVGTPSYMPPEQFMGRQVGPAADLFAWAATMVYAATGRAPFGSDTMPAVINRVLNAPPDLGSLDGALREVAAACLQKDPALRPTSEQVMMALLQHPVSGGVMLAEGARMAGAAPAWGGASARGPYPGRGNPGTSDPGAGRGGGHRGPSGWTGGKPTLPPPRPRSRAPLLIGLSIAVALVLVGAVALAIPWDEVNKTPSAAPSKTSARQRAATPTPTRRPPSEVRVVKLPGAAVNLHESEADPINLTSYSLYNENQKRWIDYARDRPRSAFQRYAKNMETRLSPDGRLLAFRGDDYADDGFDYIVIVDVADGGRSTVKTVSRPEASPILSWSSDSERLLLSVESKDSDGKWKYRGFSIVDVATRKARTTRVDNFQLGEESFGWDAEEKGVVSVYGKYAGLRFFNTDGRRTRDVPRVGELPSGIQNVFSPDGTRFVTNCPGGNDGDHCLWDSDTGKRVKRFESPCDQVLGWYDDTHLYCWEQDDGVRDEVMVVDFSGKLTRKLLDVADDVRFAPNFSPAKGS